MVGNNKASFAGIGGIGSQIWPLTGPEIISRDKLRELRSRSDAAGFGNLLFHVTALAATCVLVYFTQGYLWLQIPAMLMYGTVIVLLFAPLHECSHSTAFRTRWINYVVGYVIGFFTQRPFLYFKYRHAAHHTYTQHHDHDPDIVPFPTSLGEYFALIAGVEFWPKLFGTLWRGTLGLYNNDEKSFLPESVRSHVSAEIRLYVLGYAAIAAASVYFGTWAAITYWILPRMIGEPVLRAIRMAEHTGAEESPNLLANTRTTLTNPLMRRLHWNMPFHAEHHLASSVPFHALGKLHDHVEPHLEFVTKGYIQVHREILREVMKAGKRVPVS